MAEKKHYAPRSAGNYYIRNSKIALSEEQFAYAKELGYEGENSFQIGCVCRSREHANQLLKDYGLDYVKFTTDNSKRAHKVLSDDDWLRMLMCRRFRCDDHDRTTSYWNEGIVCAIIPVEEKGIRTNHFVDIYLMNPNTMPELQPGTDVFHVTTSKTTGKRIRKGPFIYVGTIQKNSKTVVQCMTYSDKTGIQLYNFRREELVIGTHINYFVQEMKEQFENRKEKE